jgi:hypothetical protein
MSVRIAGAVMSVGRTMALRVGVARVAHVASAGVIRGAIRMLRRRG